MPAPNFLIGPLSQSLGAFKELRSAGPRRFGAGGKILATVFTGACCPRRGARRLAPRCPPGPAATGREAAPAERGPVPVEARSWGDLGGGHGLAAPFSSCNSGRSVAAGLPPGLPRPGEPVPRRSGGAGSVRIPGRERWVGKRGVPQAPPKSSGRAPGGRARCEPPHPPFLLCGSWGGALT